MQQSSLREHIMGRRLAAYLIDWLVSLVLGCFVIVVTTIVLLAASDLDRRDVPARAVYAAILILSLWPPLWLIYTSLSWSRRGATWGMSALGIAVVDAGGSRPGMVRSLWRTLALALFSMPLVIAPLVVIMLITMGTIGPLYTLIPVFAVIVAAAFGCAIGFFSKDGRTWHDRLSGTRVVRAPRRLHAR